MNHDPISDLKRYAAALEAQVSDERARSAARMALRTPSPVMSSPTSSPTRSPRRVVVAVATTVLMGVSNVALATVADPSIPGDPLYGLDRAYESVGAALGLSNQHASERATEVLALQERGKSAEALDLVQETLTTLLDSDDPKAAVQQFTAGLGNESFAATLQQLLDEARGVDTTGAAVSAIARTIVESIELPEQANGNPGGKDDQSNNGNADGNENANENGNGRPDNPGEQGRGNNPTTGVGTSGNNGQGGGKP